MAWAMPHAMERSVATPTIKARLPARKPIDHTSCPASGHGRRSVRQSEAVAQAASAAGSSHADGQLLARGDPGAGPDAIPGHDLFDRHLEQLGDLRERIASA